MFKIKNIGLSLFFSLIFYGGKSQKINVPHVIDSLNNKILLINDPKKALDVYCTNIFADQFVDPPDVLLLHAFFLKGLRLAISINSIDHELLIHCNTSATFRMQSSIDSALMFAKVAESKLPLCKTDSTKAVVYLELAECFEKQAEPIKACVNFNKAYDIALGRGDFKLESKISHRLANLYYLQGDTAEAVRQIYKSINVNRVNNQGERLLDDYTELGRITDHISYLDTVFKIADSLHLTSKTDKAKLMLLNIYAFRERNPAKAIRFLNTDFKHSKIKTDIDFYNYYIAQVYSNCGKGDSAIYYLKLCEKPLLNRFRDSYRAGIYKHFAIAYTLQGNYKSAIKYYEMMFDQSRKSSDRLNIAFASDSLSKLYGKIGEFRKAYELKVISAETLNSLSGSSKDKQLVLLGMERETKKLEEEQQKEKERIQKKHKLQYIGITTGISIVFLLFFMMGTMKVSKTVIRIFGFVYFIGLFEFIIILIDNSIIIPITHHDPLKYWLMKILLLIMLIPIQQKIEHSLLHLVQAGGFAVLKKKLQNFSLNFDYRKKKKDQVIQENTSGLIKGGQVEILPVVSESLSESVITSIKEYIEPNQANGFNEKQQEELIKNEQEIKKIEEKLELINSQIKLANQITVTDRDQVSSTSEPLTDETEHVLGTS